MNTAKLESKARQLQKDIARLKESDDRTAIEILRDVQELATAIDRTCERTIEEMEQGR